jgi:phage repressor protein C with HTH and peptisase S24 domain
MITVYTICDTRHMDTMGDRLRKARADAGFSSARKAALRHGWTISTYAAHENGQNDFDEDAAKDYGRAFHVSAGWLLTGEGAAERQNIVGVKGLVGAGGSIDTGAEQIPPEGNLYEIEAPFPMPAGAFALQVSGESMFPRYDSGDVIVCARHSDNPEQLVGWEVAVQTTEGTRFLKRLIKGSRKGVYDLESFNAPTMRGLRLAWASPIHGVVRFGQWRRLDDQGRGRALRRAAR